MKPLPVEMPPGYTGRVAEKNRMRKFSFPAALHSSVLASENVANSARRRLSNVSESVTRKLSNTIGWPINPIPTKDIVKHGKCFCGQYILFRLKRAGLFSRKIGLQRVKYLIGDINIAKVQETFPVIAFVSNELERTQSKVYGNIARQLARSTNGNFQRPDDVKFIMSCAARELFQAGDITWSKIISMYVVAGGYAVDCVKNGYLDYFEEIVDAMGYIIESYLVGWIHDKGGWSSIYSHYCIRKTTAPNIEWAVLIFGAVMCLLVGISLIKIFS